MSEMILDAQEIVSLSRKGSSPPDGDVFITSTMAQELFFLRVKGSGKPACWIPAIHKVRHANLMDRKDWRLLVKEYSFRGSACHDHHLDRLVADFDRDCPLLLRRGTLQSLGSSMNERGGFFQRVPTLAA